MVAISNAGKGATDTAAVESTAEDRLRVSLEESLDALSMASFSSHFHQVIEKGNFKAFFNQPGIDEGHPSELQIEIRGSVRSQGPLVSIRIENLDESQLASMASYFSSMCDSGTPLSHTHFKGELLTPQAVYEIISELKSLGVDYTCSAGNEPLHASTAYYGSLIAINGDDGTISVPRVEEVAYSFLEEVDTLFTALSDDPLNDSFESKLAHYGKNIGLDFVPLAGSVSSYLDARAEFEAGLKNKDSDLIHQARSDYVHATVQLVMEAGEELLGYIPHTILKVVHTIARVEQVQELTPEEHEHSTVIDNLAEVVMKIPGAKKLIDRLLLVAEPEEVHKLCLDLERDEDQLDSSQKAA